MPAPQRARRVLEAVAVAPAFGWRMFELYARDVPRTDRPDGRRLALFVLKDRRNATRVARAFVGSGYTLAGSEEFGSQLILQVWAPRASTSR